MEITIRTILQRLEVLAPAALAESWDNVGLLVGDPASPVTRVLVALDASSDVVEQAVDQGAELIVTHHPIIFSPLKRLVEDGGAASLVRQLVRAGIGLIAQHTNLDSAPDGLNQYVGTLFDLQELRPLVPSAAKPLLKLVVYVPEEAVDAVRTAICAAGAGQIGHYGECTFGTPGTGIFRPEEGTHPYLGKVGKLERVKEVRLETVVPQATTGRVISAMFDAHPYEEVAYDLLPLENAWPNAGMGRVGKLAAPTTAGDFARRVAAELQTDRIELVGDSSTPVTTVALCTGSGGDLVEAAKSTGADLLLTGEIKHSHALLARQQGIAVLAAGHFATERPATALLTDYLHGQFPSLAVVAADETDPLALAIRR